jgi:hypothetical protein
VWTSSTRKTRGTRCLISGSSSEILPFGSRSCAIWDGNSLIESAALPANAAGALFIAASTARPVGGRSGDAHLGDKFRITDQQKAVEALGLLAGLGLGGAGA